MWFFFFNLSSVAEGTNPHIAGSLRLVFRYHGGGEGSAQLQTLTCDTLCKKLKEENLKLGLYVKCKPVPIHVYPTKGFLPLLLLLQVRRKKKKKKHLKICHLIPVMPTLRTELVVNGSPKAAGKFRLPGHSLSSRGLLLTLMTLREQLRSQACKAVASLSSHSSQEPWDSSLHQTGVWALALSQFGT